MSPNNQRRWSLGVVAGALRELGGLTDVASMPTRHTALFYAAWSLERYVTESGAHAEVGIDQRLRAKLPDHARREISAVLTTEITTRLRGEEGYYAPLARVSAVDLLEAALVLGVCR